MLQPINVMIQVWTVRCSHNLSSQWFPATLLLLVWCHMINIISFYQIRGLGQMKHMFSWCTWKLWNLLDWLLTSRMQECSDECLSQPNTCRRCTQWLLDIHQTEQEIRSHTAVPSTHTAEHWRNMTQCPNSSYDCEYSLHTCSPH